MEEIQKEIRVFVSYIMNDDGTITLDSEEIEREFEDKLNKLELKINKNNKLK